eukprot:364575-Chlamydomonas_euryale.AAC.8
MAAVVPLAEKNTALVGSRQPAGSAQPDSLLSASLLLQMGLELVNRPWRRHRSPKLAPPLCVCGLAHRSPARPLHRCACGDSLIAPPSPPAPPLCVCGFAPPAGVRCCNCTD